MKYTETATGYSHSVEYDYDDINNLTEQVEIINGTSHTTTYDYDEDNRVTSKTTDGITVSYTYDALGRVTQQLTQNGSTTILTESYTFTANSSQIATYRTVSSGYDKTYTYTYDANGNILSVSDGTNTTSYVYDSQNQLIRENNQAGGFTHVWAYDNAGNIQSRAEYEYSASTLGAHRYTLDYTYGDSEWGDLLTAYDGDLIWYDALGNRIGDCDWLYTWEHGRELTSIYDANVTWSFTYDANGMRTKRTDGTSTYSYVYNGDKLVRLIVDAQEYFDFYFTYDANGTPLTMTENGMTYYYVTNLQGDVIGIIDQSGVQIAAYTYDAWGNVLTHTNTQLADYNPLRYRGYVYDASRLVDKAEETIDTVGSVARKTDFYVTPSGEAIPATRSMFDYNLSKMDEINGKYIGSDSNGPIRIRTNEIHLDKGNFSGIKNPFHTSYHFHIDRRLHGDTGKWVEVFTELMEKIR